MARIHSPSIVTNGIVCYIDAANSKSYPGSGTTWTNLVSGTNNATLVNSPTFNSTAPQSFTFDGTNDYITLGTFFNYQSFTISFWINTGATQPAYSNIFDVNHSGSQGVVIQQNNLDTNSYYFVPIDASGGISQAFFTLTPNVWTNITFTFTPSDRSIAYINGAFSSQGALANNRNIAYVSPLLDIGRWIGGNSRFWSGKIANFMAYNRVLTAAEVSQNFEALRGRYGI